MEASEAMVWRMGEAERDIRGLDERTRDLPARVKAVEDTQADLKDAINKLTWAIVGFAFTVASSAVAVLVAVIQP